MRIKCEIIIIIIIIIIVTIYWVLILYFFPDAMLIASHTFNQHHNPLKWPFSVLFPDERTEAPQTSAKCPNPQP